MHRRDTSLDQNSVDKLQASTSQDSTAPLLQGIALPLSLIASVLPKDTQHHAAAGGARSTNQQSGGRGASLRLQAAFACPQLQLAHGTRGQHTSQQVTRKQRPQHATRCNTCRTYTPSCVNADAPQAEWAALTSSQAAPLQGVRRSCRDVQCTCTCQRQPTTAYPCWHQLRHHSHSKGPFVASA